MKSSATASLCIAFLLALPAGTADAQQPGPQAAAPNLQTCVQACMVQRHVCIQGMTKDLDVVCAGIPECAGISAPDKASFNSICDACAKSETTYCGGQKTAPSAASPPKTKGPGPTTQALTPEAICRHQRGGVWVDGTCFTLLGAHNQLADHEKRLRVLEQTVAELKGQVPPGVKTQIVTETTDTQKILDGLKQVSGMVTDYERNIESLIAGLRNDLAQQVKRLDGRIDGQARQQGVRDADQDRAIAEKGNGGSARGALTGWSIGPYFARQAYNLYDQGLNGGGGEASVFWSISETGRTRLALNAGGGFGGRYFDHNLTEIHGHFGVRHSWDIFSLTFGPGFNWRSDGFLNQAKAAWFGGIIEPRVSFLNKDGHGLYLYGLTGLGITWFAKEPIEYIHKTDTKFDMPVMFGIGYEFLPSK
jgi:hypothetical protein